MIEGKSSTTLHGDNAAWPTAPALAPTKAESMSVMIGFAAKMPSAGAANLMTLAKSVSEGGGGASDAAAAPLLAGSAAEAAQRTAARRRRGAIRQHSSGRAVRSAQPRVAIDAQRSPRTREPPGGIARGAAQCSVMALGISPAARRFRGGALRWRRALSSRLYVLRAPAPRQSAKGAASGAARAAKLGAASPRSWQRPGSEGLWWRGTRSGGARARRRRLAWLIQRHRSSRTQRQTLLFIHSVIMTSLLREGVLCG